MSISNDLMANIVAGFSLLVCATLATWYIWRAAQQGASLASLINEPSPPAPLWQSSTTTTEYAPAPEPETITLEKPRKAMLPELATKLCYAASGWVVGGAAREATPRDYDIAVPLAYWPVAAQLIPRDARPNAFGGWKCQSEGKTVDVWPADLGQLMTNDLVTDLWHPQSGKRFTASR